MTAATVRARPAGIAEDLEVPRPLRLLLTAGWSLGESVGLPVAAYAVAAWLAGRDAGLVAGLVSGSSAPRVDPDVVLFVFLQRYFMEGATAGAIK